MEVAQQRQESGRIMVQQCMLRHIAAYKPKYGRHQTAASLYILCVYMYVCVGALIWTTLQPLSNSNYYGNLR